MATLPGNVKIYCEDAYDKKRHAAEVPSDTLLEQLANDFCRYRGWHRYPYWEQRRAIIVDLMNQLDPNSAKPLVLGKRIEDYGIVNEDVLRISLDVPLTSDSGSGFKPYDGGKDEGTPDVPPIPPGDPADPGTMAVSTWLALEFAWIEGRLTASQQFFQERMRSRIDDVYTRLEETGRALVGIRDVLAENRHNLAEVGQLRNQIDGLQETVETRVSSVEVRLGEIQNGLEKVETALTVVGRKLKITEFSPVGGRTVSWLHFSDLHLCRFRTNRDPSRISDALCRDLEVLKQKGLVPNLVFFTGDAAFGQVGQLDDAPIDRQFKAAQDLFDRVLGLFAPNLPRENLFIVPGNHDINRDQVPGLMHRQLHRLAAQGTSDEQRGVQDSGRQITKDWQTCMDRLRDFRRFLREGYPHLVQDPERLVFGDERLVNNIRVGVAGLNSAWSCGLDGKDERQAIWLGNQWQFAAALAKLHGTDIRVMLTHHPLEWFAPAEQQEMEMQARTGFHFWLHGHDSQAAVTSTSSRHLRISAGSAYKGDLNESGYNFVRLNFDTGTGEVWLRRFDGEQWGPYVIDGETDDEGKRPIYDLCFTDPAE